MPELYFVVCLVLMFLFFWGGGEGNPVNLDKELLVCQREYIGDGGGFIVQAETRQQQQQRRWGGASLVSCALAKLARRLAHKLDEVHHEALTHALTAELPL